MSLDVSVLVPVYNSSEFLKRCLDSILNQKFQGSFEVILVNDGSTDNSLNILMSYKKRYDNVIVINHINNKKLSQARKTAFEASTGKYIWNVDSDDWIEPNSMQLLFDFAEENQSDIIVMNSYKAFSLTHKTTHIDVSDAPQDQKSMVSLFDGAIWNKFIKKNVVNSSYVLFNLSVNSGEDFLYCTELLMNTEKIHLLPLNLYNYFSNKDSITSTVNRLELLNNYYTLLISTFKILEKYDIRDFLIYIYIRDSFITINTIISYLDNASYKQSKYERNRLIDTYNKIRSSHGLSKFQISNDISVFKSYLNLLKYGKFRRALSILKYHLKNVYIKCVTL